MAEQSKDALFDFLNYASEKNLMKKGGCSGLQIREPHGFLDPGRPGAGGHLYP